MDAQIIPANQIPPRSAKWSSVMKALRVLQMGNALVLEVNGKAKSNMRAIHLYSRRLGFKVRIQIIEKKLYITRKGK